MSYNDFPEIFLCLFQECSQQSTGQQDLPSSIPFVTFFSGHIATLVIIANHLYMRKYIFLSVCLHSFNWLQAIRLLATRGHYSIDLIIGYVVAVFVSNPAARLGLYYSRGIAPEFRLGSLSPRSSSNGKDEREDTTLTQSSSVSDRILSYEDLNNLQSDTSMCVAVDIVTDLAQKCA